MTADSGPFDPRLRAGRQAAELSQQKVAKQAGPSVRAPSSLAAAEDLPAALNLFRETGNRGDEATGLTQIGELHRMQSGKMSGTVRASDLRNNRRINQSVLNSTASEDRLASVV